MIEITYLAIAGIALVAMFFGYGFGLFEGRSQGYKKRRKEEATEKENKPEPAVPEPVMVKVDDPGLLRIQNEGGYLTLDLDGSRVDTSALTTDERKRLIEMLNLMRPWLEGRPAAVPERTAPPPPSQPKPSPATELDRLARVSSQPESADQPPAQPAATARPGVPAPQPASQSTSQRSRTIAKEDRPIPPAGSIVSQIDSILQAHLEGTPLDERGIFLAQSPEGSVMVYVGLTKYMGIEDIPDPEIKAAIRSAITDWENRYTPGL